MLTAAVSGVFAILQRRPTPIYSNVKVTFQYEFIGFHLIIVERI